MSAMRYGSTNQANSAFHPFGVGKWVVIHVITLITGVETIKMAYQGCVWPVGSRSVYGRRLYARCLWHEQRPLRYAACGAIQVLYAFTFSQQQSGPTFPVPCFQYRRDPRWSDHWRTERRQTGSKDNSSRLASAAHRDAAADSRLTVAASEI